MVTGGKPLVMHCSVSKLLDSGVSIFRMLPRISYSGLGTDTVRKKLAFYLLPLMNHELYLFLFFCSPNTISITLPFILHLM